MQNNNIKTLTEREQNYLNFNRILHNIQNYTFFKYIGCFDISDLSKSEIKDIKSAILKCDKDNANNKKWLNDKQFFINYINNYCVACRWYSLIIQ